MQLKPLILALIMALTAFASISVQASGPDCDPNNQNPLDPVVPVLAENGVACTLVTGPGVFSVQGGPSLGLNQIKTAPGLGAAFFDVSSWDPSVTWHHVDVWVEWTGNSGFCGVAGFFCGFDIELCQDTNDNEVCGGEDSTHSALAADNQNYHPLGPLGTDADCEDKDTKNDATNPCTGLSAELSNVCIGQDTLDGNDDGSWDDIVVFISAWVGVNDATLGVIEDKDYINAGIALGQFDVTVHDDGDVDPHGCVGDPDEPEPFNCEGDWENVNETVALGGAQCYTQGEIDTEACFSDVDDAGATRTVTMLCFAIHGCEEHKIIVGAWVVDPVDGATADTTLWCDEDTDGIVDPSDFVLTDDAGPGTDADVERGTKTFGDYYCIMEFRGPVAGAWVAGGFCQDDPRP